MVIIENRSEITGVRLTHLGTKVTKNTYADSASNPIHDSSLDDQLGVPGDGNCLYWAFGVLLGTYGVYHDSKYVQQHLQPQAIRNRLARRIRDPKNWLGHFLRILEIVRDVNKRPVGGLNGPPPADLEASQNAVDKVTKYLKTLGIPAGDHFDNEQFNRSFEINSQGLQEASVDPSESAQEKLKNHIDLLSTDMMNEMQYIVNTFIDTHLARDTQYAESFEVELLAEASLTPAHAHVCSRPLTIACDFTGVWGRHLLLRWRGEPTTRKPRRRLRRGPTRAHHVSQR